MFIKDIVSGTFNLNSTAAQYMLNKAEKYITKEDLTKLSSAEKIQAIFQGRTKAGFATSMSLLSGVGTEAAGAVGLRFLGAAQTTAGYLPLALAAAVSYVAGVCYNKFHVEHLIENAEILIDQYKDLYDNVRDGIIRHHWIGSNVLILSMSTVPRCGMVDHEFLNIEGVKYNKTQAAINKKFAKLECRFLEQDHDDCNREAMKAINCDWENDDTGFVCDRNPYNNPKTAILKPISTHKYLPQHCEREIKQIICSTGN